jgi:L-2-hydroxyglutarate oxidase LhgO
LTAADIETLVVGGGVIGLAAARSLSQGGSNVLLLERNDRTGAEISSRNSEVIHAGLYYPTGSLRARLCVDGKHRLYQFAEENGVAVSPCGKLLVATSEAELPMLESIAERAAANGVDDLARLDRKAAKAMEPEVECIAALFSPSTGVIDTHALMTALEGHLTSSGGEVVLSTEVVGISLLDSGLFEIQTRNTAGPGSSTLAITAKNLILAAGLEGTRVGEFLNGHWREGYTCPRTYPAKGHYFTLSARAPFTRLIYPIPSGAWLGIHLTLDIAGQAKFGPDLEWVEKIDYSFDDPDGARRQTFINEVRRYWPQLPADALQPGYTGIRPKIYRRGEPTPDFAIHGPQTHGVKNLVALYGIESPGLTSSLAIADYVADIITPER